MAWTRSRCLREHRHGEKTGRHEQQVFLDTTLSRRREVPPKEDPSWALSCCKSDGTTDQTAHLMGPGIICPSAYSLVSESSTALHGVLCVYVLRDSTEYMTLKCNSFCLCTCLPRPSLSTVYDSATLR